jgi:hypothetical protein
MGTGNGGQRVRGGTWPWTAVSLALIAAAGALAMGSLARHGDALLAAPAWVQAAVGLIGLARNRSAVVAAGRAIARWVQGGFWRLRALIALLAALTLGAAAATVVLHEPRIFFDLAVLVMVFVAGLGAAAAVRGSSSRAATACSAEPNGGFATRSKWGAVLLIVAEGEGFEPSRRCYRLRDFQSRALGQAMRPFQI